MWFSKQEYWGGLPFPSPEDLPNPGTEPESSTLQADFFTVWATREAQFYVWKMLKMALQSISRSFQGPVNNHTPLAWWCFGRCSKAALRPPPHQGLLFWRDSLHWDLWASSWEVAQKTQLLGPWGVIWVQPGTSLEVIWTLGISLFFFFRPSDSPGVVPGRATASSHVRNSDSWAISQSFLGESPGCPCRRLEFTLKPRAIEGDLGRLNEKWKHPFRNSQNIPLPRAQLLAQHLTPTVLLFLFHFSEIGVYSAPLGQSSTGPRSPLSPPPQGLCHILHPLSRTSLLPLSLYWLLLVDV